ncbi:MAG: T9SS type A sorting domain-containing protein [Fidelibacterota bacterium]|nr:MAG: T9SS type A sorting domain-containing protein [Candidatus Neomarinimicrobiota bacterium]
MFGRNLLLALSLFSSVLSAQVSSVDFATQVYPIFNDAGCMGCHGSNGGFTIGSTAAVAYDNLVNSSSLGTCQKTYVVPGNPSGSFLYEKISGAPSCGDRMPRNNQNYFDSHQDQLETIRVWIEEGALSEPAPLAANGVERALPEKFELEQNFPNPFNPSTTISYHLPRSAHVILTIYDVLGTEVITLVNGVQPGGTYQVRWTGIDRHGDPVGTGIYFYGLQAGSEMRMRKMILLQ